MTDAAIRRLAKRLGDLERQAVIRRQPSLPNSSITSGSVQILDDDEAVQAVVGLQFDGTNTVAVIRGPVPPTPTVPGVFPSPGALRIYWDGTFADGSAAPLDFARVTAHAVELASFDPDTFTPSQDSIVGSFGHAAGGEISAVLTPGVQYAVILVAWSQAGKPSAASEPATGTPVGIGGGDSGPSAPLASSPAVEIKGTADALVLTLTDDIDQFTTVEYHISTVADFTPDATTLLAGGAVRSPIYVAAAMPDGSLLDVDATYYVRTQVHNGLLPDPPPGPTTLGTLDPSIASSIALAQVKAGFVLAGEIRVGDMSISPENGIVIPQINGGMTNFPVDGSTAAIDAYVTARGLDVKDDLTIEGYGELKGNLAIVNGVTNPTTKPTLSTNVGFFDLRMSVGMNTAFQVVFYQGNWEAWIMTGYTGTDIGRFDLYTGASKGTLALSGLQSASRGVVAFSFDESTQRVYVAQVGLPNSNGTQPFILSTVDIATGAVLFTTTINGPTTNMMFADYPAKESKASVAAIDSASFGLAWRATDGSVKMATWSYNPAANNSAIAETAPVTVEAASKNYTPRAILPFYFARTDTTGGGPGRLGAVMQGSGPGISILSYDYGGVRQTDEFIDIAGSDAVIHMHTRVGSDGSAAIYTLAESGVIRSYNWSNAPVAVNVGYAWADSDPTGGYHQTAMSPAETKTIANGRWLGVTVPDPPELDITDPARTDKANTANLYMKVAAFGMTDFIYQGTIGAGFGGTTYSNFDPFIVDLAGSTPSPTNGFIGTGAAPGAILSSAVDSNGKALVSLKGDGSGRGGDLSWDSTGKVAIVQPYLFMQKDGTNQALTAATWTEVQGWVVKTLRRLDQAYSRVTIQEAGRYFVSFNVAFTPDTSRCLGAITLNDTQGGAPLARFDVTPTGSDRVAQNLSCVIECVPGDIIRGLVYVAAASRSVASGLCSMSVAKIG